MIGMAWRARAIQIGFVVLFVLGWIVVGDARLVSPIFVPRFERVMTELVRIVSSGAVFVYLAVTLFELFAAYALALIAGLTVGFVIGRSRFWAAVFEPLLNGIFAVPIIIFLPLFILFLGIGIESKIAFGATYAFFPIALNTIGGVGAVDARFVTVAQSLGATRWQMFKRVLLPAALPVVVTGIRIGFLIGFFSIIGSEMIAGLDGLGSQIVQLGEGMNTAAMFAYILFVILIAAILNTLLSLLQSRFSRVEAVS
jgi:ABC-type nitrate/sulfonate/bicarbonate transport system permease component